MRIGGTCCAGGKERHKPMDIYKVVQKNGKNVSFLALFSSDHQTMGLMEQPQLTVYQMVTFLHLGHVLNAHSINIYALKVAGQKLQCLITKICLSSFTIYIYTHICYCQWTSLTWRTSILLYTWHIAFQCLSRSQSTVLRHTKYCRHLLNWTTQKFKTHLRKENVRMCY